MQNEQNSVVLAVSSFLGGWFKIRAHSSVCQSPWWLLGLAMKAWPRSHIEFKDSFQGKEEHFVWDRLYKWPMHPLFYHRLLLHQQLLGITCLWHTPHQIGPFLTVVFKSNFSIPVRKEKKEVSWENSMDKIIIAQNKIPKAVVLNYCWGWWMHEEALSRVPQEIELWLLSPSGIHNLSGFSWVRLSRGNNRTLSSWVTHSLTDTKLPRFSKELALQQKKKVSCPNFLFTLSDPQGSSDACAKLGWGQSSPHDFTFQSW